MPFDPSVDEIAERDRLIAELRRWIAEGKRILLSPDGRSPFSGAVREYEFSFEGEDDLLHLSVKRTDGRELSVEEAQTVADFVLNDVEKGLIWLKPGVFSHHFYLGHDELLRSSA